MHFFQASLATRGCPKTVFAPQKIRFFNKLNALDFQNHFCRMKVTEKLALELTLT
jgi:hypothetical protein